jgi:hypothetical protein
MQENRNLGNKLERDFGKFFKVTDFCGRKGSRMIDGRVGTRKVSIWDIIA